MIILDVGCGNRKYSQEAIGIDKIKTPCTDVVCDFEESRLPFEDKYADMITARHVIEHTDDLHLLRECRRVLKDTGTLHIETPNAYYLPVILRFALKNRYANHNDHIHCYGIVELRQLLDKVGFKIYKIEYGKILINNTPRNIYDRIAETMFNHLQCQIAVWCTKIIPRHP